MFARCSGPIGMKKRPDSRKLFERKKHGIQLQCDNFRTGCRTGPVWWPGFFDDSTKYRLNLSAVSVLHGGSLLKPPCQRIGVTPLSGA